MTRILVQRGSASGSTNPRASSLPGSSSSVPPSSSSLSRTQPQSTSPPQAKDEEIIEDLQEQTVPDEVNEFYGCNEDYVPKNDDQSVGSFIGSQSDNACSDIVDNGTDSKIVGDTRELSKVVDGLRISERLTVENDGKTCYSSPIIGGSSHPPPPPVPPPKPLAANSNSRRVSGSSNTVRLGPARRSGIRSVVSTRTSPTESRPSSPRSHGESEGYNSADEQNPCFASSYHDIERERQFEIDIRRAKGLEVKRMMEDGNCLFRAVADQVYGDSEYYDLVRQMCIDYMERERDHFSQFITEGFTSYCKRKRRDKVYGNNVEIQALSEMYNRPIHIYSYGTEPINIFHGNYNTDTPPIRLSYHHGNHYNSLVDPRRLGIGAGLGFSCLRGRNVDRDQIKAAIKSQQDQQIDNALLAEGRYYSDLELTEKEIERMVMEVSRAEYVANGTRKHMVGHKESSTSEAEPSSSGASSATRVDGGREQGCQETVLSHSMQIVLSMGFSYLQVVEAYSIFGDDVDSMVCYLLETGNSSSRRKGKATE